MKDKLIISIITITLPLSSLAGVFGGPGDVVVQLPEPSTIGLFAAAAVAIAVLAKLRK